MTGISRRAFLMGAAVATAGAAVTILPLATAETAAALVSASAVLKRSSFAPLLGATFRMVDATGRSANVILSEIHDLTGVKPGSETCFSLIFDGPITPGRASGTYRFRHPRTGDVTLFAGPVDRVVKTRHYEATIDQR